VLQQHVKKIASVGLLTKTLAVFLSLIYLLTLVLKHATNHTKRVGKHYEEATNFSINFKL
jgi:uncharacterized membrane protein YphA (DoxX/SURF4 family)